MHDPTIQPPYQMKYTIAWPVPLEWRRNPDIIYAHMVKEQTTYDPKLQNVDDFFTTTYTHTKTLVNLDLDAELLVKSKDTNNARIEIEPKVIEIKIYCDNIIRFFATVAEEVVTDDTFEEVSHICLVLPWHVGAVEYMEYSKGEHRPLYVMYHAIPKTYSICDPYEISSHTPQLEVTRINIFTEMSENDMVATLSEIIQRSAKKFRVVDWSNGETDTKSVMVGDDKVVVTSTITYVYEETLKLIDSDQSSLVVFGKESDKQKKAEDEKLEKERLAKEEADRLEKERLEKEETDRLEKERLAKEEADRLEKEKAAKLEEKKKDLEERKRVLEEEKKVLEEEKLLLTGRRLIREMNVKIKEIDEKIYAIEDELDPTKTSGGGANITTINSNINRSIYDWEDPEFDQFLHDKKKTGDDDVHDDWE